MNSEYPNVASVRGIVEAQNLARISCSGSLIHRDAEKVVILTAAHCSDSWAGAIAAGAIDSVGVSFDQNNQVGGTTTNRTFYVRGGVPISFPAKDAPFEKFDYGLVVFSASAENGIGETVSERWGALTPVQVALNHGIRVRTDRWCEQSRTGTRSRQSGTEPVRNFPFG